MSFKGFFRAAWGGVKIAAQAVVDTAGSGKPITLGNIGVAAAKVVVKPTGNGRN